MYFGHDYIFCSCHQEYHGSYSDLDSEHMKLASATAAGGGGGGGGIFGKKLSRYQSGSRESYSSRESRETGTPDTQVSWLKKKFMTSP